MTNDDYYEGTFISRNRRKLGLIGVIAAVAITVLVYNLTGPEPTAMPGTNTASQVAEGGTLEVGALPVT